jgi:hypothetical protein
MYMGGHDLLVSVLLPSPVIILVQAFDLQFNRYKSCWRYTFPVDRILHRECWICHEAVSTVEIFEALFTSISGFASINSESR